jgi:disulfide bond formation protein DsbB
MVPSRRAPAWRLAVTCEAVAGRRLSASMQHLRRHLRFHPRALSLLVAAGLLVLPSAASAATIRADFNGDGRGDLAVGAPGDNVGSTQDAGAVNVLYGTASGLSATGNQLWNQDSPGVPGVAETFDGFGASLAAGDFNGDGRADLAVGVPLEDVGGVGNAGAVQVLYGTASGLSASGNQRWHQNSPGILETADGGEWFGTELAAGDLNGDGRGDLVVGVPYEGLGGAAEVGVAQVLYGTASGLSASGNQLWHQNSPGILETAEASDHFARALAVGDMNGDGRGDLAVGIPDEGLGSLRFAGAVQVIYGTASGLSASGNQLWHQNSPGVLEAAQANEGFGGALATGDLNGHGRADLAVGVGESVGNLRTAGAVQVLYGTASGLSASGNQLWNQDSPGILETAEANDRFGVVGLAVGDLNGDDRADLAAGADQEDIGSLRNVGAVQVIYGTASGLSASGNQLWHQNSPGILDAAEEGESWGGPLVTGDLNGDGRADLTVGCPTENFGGAPRYEGAVNVIYGTLSGLSANGNQFWHQNSPGVLGSAEPNDSFSSALG